MILHDTVNVTIPDPEYGDSTIFINNIHEHRNRDSQYLAVADGPLAKMSTLTLQLSVCKGQHLQVQNWVNTYAGLDCVVTLFDVVYDAFLETKTFEYRRVNDYALVQIQIWLWEHES